MYTCIDEEKERDSGISSFMENEMCADCLNDANKLRTMGVEMRSEAITVNGGG